MTLLRTPAVRKGNASDFQQGFETLLRILAVRKVGLPPLLYSL